MKSIKELAPKPSDAIQAMVDGLIAQSQRPDFEITMSTFGDYDNAPFEMCFGCAATCAIQQIAGKNFTDGNIENIRSRATYLDFDSAELDTFEEAIDYFRCGFLGSLLVFYNVPPEMRAQVHQHINRFKKWNLLSFNWKEQLPLIQKVITYLKSINL